MADLTPIPANPSNHDLAHAIVETHACIEAVHKELNTFKADLNNKAWLIVGSISAAVFAGAISVIVNQINLHEEQQAATLKAAATLQAYSSADSKRDRDAQAQRDRDILEVITKTRGQK